MGNYHARCGAGEKPEVVKPEAYLSLFGLIPKFEKLIATIRSREISASIILQAQSQLKAIYNDNADTIIGNMDSQIFLGGTEKTTLKDLTEILGKEAIDMYTTGNTKGSQESYNMNYQKLGKELMSMDELVVNKEQAETVKRIFELYLAGNGVRKIQDIMEQEGRKTATGLTRWQSGNINRVLRNPFYCGRIVYRKQYVPDYLVQKKINNFGAVEKVYVEGTHEKLVSPEDFDRAQELRAKHRIGKRDKNGRSVGQSPCKHIWGNKLVCTCGHAMNRRIAHKAKDGNLSYIYQCYGQLRTGTPESRRKKGLEVNGICDNSSFMEWKLEVQADFIFKKLLNNKEAIYREAMSMLSDVAEVKAPERNDKEKLERNMKQLDKLHKQMANLVDMCAEGDISREVFRSKKKKLEDQISNIEKVNSECRQQILELEDNEAKDRRIESLSEFIKMTAYDARAKIPETVIDNFVDRVVFDHGDFIWYLNPTFGNEVYSQTTSDWKKNNCRPLQVI